MNPSYDDTAAPHLSRGFAGSRPSEPSEGTVSEAAAKTADAAAEATIDVAEWAHTTRQQMNAVVREHPYASVAAAAGLGYVLGGGMPKWLVRTAVSYGTRAAIAAVVAAAVAEEAD